MILAILMLAFAIIAVTEWHYMKLRNISLRDRALVYAVMGCSCLYIATLVLFPQLSSLSDWFQALLN